MFFKKNQTQDVVMCFKCCDGDAARLCPVSLGVAFGAVKGIWLLGLAWVGWLTGSGLAMIYRITQVFPSYGPNFLGGIVGGFFGFIYQGPLPMVFE